MLDTPQRMESTTLLWAYQIRRENSHLKEQLHSLKEIVTAGDLEGQQKRIQELTNKVIALKRDGLAADAVTQEKCRSLVDEITKRNIEHQASLVNTPMREDVRRLEAQFDETNMRLRDIQESIPVIRENVSSLEVSLKKVEKTQANNSKLIQNTMKELYQVKDSAAEDRDISAEARKLIALLAEAELNRRSKAARLELAPDTTEQRLQTSDIKAFTHEGSTSSVASVRISGQTTHPEMQTWVQSTSASMILPYQPLPSIPQQSIASFSNMTREVVQGQTQKMLLTEHTSHVRNEKAESRNVRSLSQATTQPETEIDLDDIGQDQSRLLPQAVSNPPASPPLQVHNVAASPVLPMRLQSPRVRSSLQSPQEDHQDQTGRKKDGAKARSRMTVEPTDRQTRSQAKAALAATTAASENQNEDKKRRAVDIVGPAAEKLQASQTKKRATAPKKKTAARPTSSSKKSTKKSKGSNPNEAQEERDSVEIIKKEQIELPQGKSSAKKRKRTR